MTGEWVGDIHQGDVVETLREMPESSVHMAMCSPPYYGLRDYGTDGQIGLEEELDEYVQTLVEVGDELRRVLRPDGSWWLNLGDSYSGSRSTGAATEGRDDLHRSAAVPDHSVTTETPLGRKNKMLVPHRVAIALQDAGWVVRSDAVWAKPNPMPHPVKDRFREDKEFVFHLTPDPDYWFDLDAIREPHKDSTIDRNAYAFETAGSGSANLPGETRSPEEISIDADQAAHPNGKNPGDILEISVKPFLDAHFAVYPPELCETPIKATCPPTVCAECGTPYERDIDETPLWERDMEDVDRPQAQKALTRFHTSALTVDHLKAARAVGFGDGDHGDASQGSMDRVNDRQRRLANEAKDVLGGYFREFVASPERSVGEWAATCDCDTDETGAGVVLDPFAGAGTTCLVAKRLGRRFVGIELNPDYVAMAQKRVGIDVDEPHRLLEDGQQSLESATDGGLVLGEDRRGDSP